MPRLKGSKNKPKEEEIKEVEIQEEIKEAEEEMSSPELMAPKTTIFENAKVESILEVGENFYHCKMSDGTSKHVPSELFK